MARSRDAEGGPAGDQHEEHESHDIWICDFTDADDRADFARLMAEFAAEPVSASPHLGGLSL